MYLVVVQRMKEVRPKSVGSRQVGGEGRTVRDPGPYTITVWTYEMFAKNSKVGSEKKLVFI